MAGELIEHNGKLIYEEYFPAKDFTTPPDGFVSLMGRLTAVVSETTMALVGYGEVLGPDNLIWGILVE